MRDHPWVPLAIACVTALLPAAGLLANSTAAAATAPSYQGAASGSAAGHPTGRTAGPASVQLPDLVSSSPVGWTPNVFAGASACNAQWFGSGRNYCHSTVRGTAVVNGEVVVVGAFTQACEPGPASSGHCMPGTLVTRNDIFAYQLGTGQIDPNFVPVLDQGPAYSVVAGPGNTVYIGGSFTTVNGTSSQGIAQLSVTPGQPTDGQLAPGFAGQVNGTVLALSFDGANALYAGGHFTQVDGVKRRALARLDATTGAVDPSFTFTLGDPITGTPLQVEQTALTPSGDTLVISGTFQSVNGQAISRIALINTGGGLGAPATLDNWAAPILTNPCSAEHDYTRAIDVSPDGSFFVVATTGYRSAGGPSICDAVARFEIGATGTNVQPTWINYSGGDSFYAVAVTNTVVYTGGHNRWVNNECGDNFVCEANAVLSNGLAALDAHTGLALPWWQPLTSRGSGVTSLTLFPGGLLVGTNVNSIGGAYHSEHALFPLTDTSVHATGGPIESGIWSLGRPGGEDETTNGPPALCLDAADNSSSPGTVVQLATCANLNSQIWTLGTDGTIQINGVCLDTSGEGTGNGTLAVLNTCNGSPTQTWTPGTGSTLVNQGSGSCLDDPGASTTNDTQLQIWSCDGSAQQSWPLPVAQAPPAPPGTGPVALAQTQSNSQVACLTSARATPRTGTAVILHTCLGGPTQLWTTEADGTFRLDGLCLDTAAQGTSQGTPTVLSTCDGSPTQMWTPQWSGSLVPLVNQASGLCLDDPGYNTANGTQLQIYGCSGGWNQRWLLPML